MSAEQAVIDDPQAAAPAAAPAATPAPPPPDRGDVVQIEDDDAPSAEALEALVASAPAPSPAPAHDENKGGIPKARFDEVNEERKRLKVQVEELTRAQQQAAAPAPSPTPAPPPPFNEDEAESQYAELLMDGKTKEAVELRKSINRHLQSQAEQAADAKYQARQSETAAQAAQRQLDEAAAKAVQDFPYLETEEGAGVQKMIVGYRDQLVADGMPIAEALRKAVADLAPKFKPAEAAAPAPAAAPAADKRAADALARGAADSQRQPPAVPAGVGNRATAGTVKASQMTDAEFDALPAAEKRRMRGDEG